jgi:flagellar biosynthesis protein FlhB
MFHYCLLAVDLHRPQACHEAAGKCLFCVVFGALLLGAIFGIVAQVIQVGIQFHFGILSPQVARLDPVKGSGRILSGLADSWQILLRLVLLAIVFSWLLRSVLAGLPTAQITSAEELTALFPPVVRLVPWGVLVLMLLGAIDYLLKRRGFFRKLGMSYDEIRREQREDEGDPYVRMMRRSMHEMLAMEQLAQRVKQAKVVVVEEQ